MSELRLTSYYKEQVRSNMNPNQVNTVEHEQVLSVDSESVTGVSKTDANQYFVIIGQMQFQISYASYQKVCKAKGWEPIEPPTKSNVKKLEKAK